MIQGLDPFCSATLQTRLRSCFAFAVDSFCAHGKVPTEVLEPTTDAKLSCMFRQALLEEVPAANIILIYTCFSREEARSRLHQLCGRDFGETPS